jgi:FKBP-type peptidyl-prolyl cis-trans isomerase FkpA
MRKSSLWIICALLCLCNFNCAKNNASSPCTNRSAAQDEPAILAYLAANSITGYVKHPSGLYYKIITQGSGVGASISSKVFVKYTGTYTDKTSFDAVSDASKTGWVLGTLIQAWQIGIPLIQKGGKIQLFVPSALGYGCQQTGPIPGNSVLIFEVELVDVL